jgi:HK97 family phage prohead protease
MLQLQVQQATDEELETVKKDLGDDIPAGYIAGYASTPDLDSYRDVVIPGAFDKSIQERGLTGPKGIKLLLNHNWSQLAGVIKKLETRNNKLWIEAQMNLDVQAVREMYSNIKAVGGLSFSVGFFLQEYNIRQDAQNRDYFELVKGDLFEVSIVPFPANSEAVMEFVKSTEIELSEMGLPDDEEEAEMLTIADFEKMLVANGLAKSRNDARLITLEVKQALHVFSTKTIPPETETSPVEKQNEQAPVAEDVMQKALERMAAIRTSLTPKSA